MNCLGLVLFCEEKEWCGLKGTPVEARRDFDLVLLLSNRLNLLKLRKLT